MCRSMARIWGSATGEALWKELQPLVLYRAAEGVEDAFELLLNLLLGSHHNQLVVTCPPSSDQVCQGKASTSGVCKVAPCHEGEGERSPCLLPSLLGGGAEPSSHTPEQDNVSRRAWRQLLLSWLLCQRVQSSQVELSCCNSQCGACCKSRRFSSPHCLNLEWAQIMEPTNTAWHYGSRTESWCLLIFSYEEEWGGWLG